VLASTGFTPDAWLHISYSKCSPLPNISFRRMTQPLSDILVVCCQIQILRTPYMFSDPLSRQANIGVYLKQESLQPGGSVKFRGANNAVNMLNPEEREKGVLTASRIGEE
jgi:threonine dehydratase